MEWGAAIAAVLGVILWGLKQWQANQPKRETEATADEDQKLRTECNNLDADAVSARIDGLLNPAGDHPAGVADGSPQSRGTGTK